MRRILARVTLSELTSQVNAYPPWELPILNLVHGGQVRAIGTEYDDQPVPSPEAEYLRLERRFGTIKGTGQSRVSQTYGEGELGVQRLAEAMREDLLEQAELDALPDEERELRRMQNERERLDRDIASLERRRRADGSGPATYREALGRARVEEIRAAEERGRRQVVRDPMREALLDEREARIAERERALEAKLEAPTDAIAGPAPDAPAEPKGPGDEAETAHTGRSRRRA